MSLNFVARLARSCARPSPAFRIPASSSVPHSRSLATKVPFPTVPDCPSPTCQCAPTPAMPEGLPIDHDTKLNGLISNYAQQLLICTGNHDWPSKIETENEGDNLAADLRKLIGPKGVYSDPYHNVSVLNASFPASPTGKPSTSAYILPAFKYVPSIPRDSFESLEGLTKGYLLPEKLHPAHDNMSSMQHDRLTRDPAYRQFVPGVRDVHDIFVLICGHGGRDMRCGITGPVLQDEFRDRLPEAGVQVLEGPAEGREASGAGAATEGKTSARVGLISHIGGHKFAGNLIIYLPPSLKAPDGKPHPLAGHGVWYGRVEPRHVQGIVDETIIKGNVITEFFRGAIRQDGHIMRL